MRGWMPVQGEPVGDKVLPADLELRVEIGGFQLQGSKDGHLAKQQTGHALDVGAGLRFLARS